jgi:hypothetical protein
MYRVAMTVRRHVVGYYLDTARRSPGSFGGCSASEGRCYSVTAM